MEKISKIILALTFLGILSGLFIINVSHAQAATAEELKQMIAQLQAQLATLQQQLAETQRKAWCHDFNTNLKIGDSGNEVNELQTALEKEGFEINDSEQKGYANFGESTASSVVGFQEKYASDILTPWGLKHGTGYVGTTTRAKLNELYGCFAKSSITVVSPNGGEEWVSKTTQIITWKSVNIPDGQPINVISLVGSNGVEYYRLKTDTPNDGAEAITVPTLTKPGDFKVKIETTVQKQAVTDMSDGYVRINPSTPSLSINVLSPNGGEKIKLHEAFDITWASSGVENAYLYLWFADGGTCKIADVSAELGTYSAVFMTGEQCLNVPRTIIPGQYKILITTEIEGLQDASDNYFSIVEAITCTDSDGGKNYYQKGTVTENGKTYTDYCQGSFYLKEYFCLPYSSTGLGGVAEENVVCPNNGSCKDGACVKEKSITVISPSGGEVWTIGKSYEIKWCGKNFSSSDFPGSIAIQLADVSTGAKRSNKLVVGIKDVKGIAECPETDSYSWKAGLTIDPSVFYPVGDYKINVTFLNEKFGKAAPGNQSGNFRIVENRETPIPTLQLVLSPDSPISQTIYLGTTNFAFLRAKFSNYSSEDIKIDEVRVNMEGVVSPPLVSNIKLYSGSVQIGSTIPLAESGLLAFKNLNWTIGKNTSGTLTVKADILATEQPGVVETPLRFSIYPGNVSGQGLTSGEFIMVSGEEARGSEMIVVFQKPSLTVLSPNGGEKWRVGQFYNITWKYHEPIAPHVNIVLLQWSEIGSYQEFPIISGIDTNKQRYSWKIELPSGYDKDQTDKWKVKIYESEVFHPSSAISDESDNYFSIVSETCHTSSLWSWDYCSQTCKCDAGQGDCDADNDCNTGYCAQNVGTKYGQVSSMDVCEEKGEKSITVISPNGGESWIIGKTYDITWKSLGADRVDIYLADASIRCTLACEPGKVCAPCYAKQLIATQVLASWGKYSWTIPSTQTVKSTYQIRVQDVNYSTTRIYDDSDNNFSITNCRDESYGCTIENIPCCKGLTSVPLALPGTDGECIAATCGNICRPCGNGVCDKNENECNCPEDCKGKTITVLSPNGGEKWEIGKSYEISFSAQWGVSVNSLKFSLRDKRNDSFRYFSLADTICSTTTGADMKSVCFGYWTVPSDVVAGEKVFKVRIESSESSANHVSYDESDNYFSIVSLTTVCTDSDGGKNYYQKGTVTENGKTYTDYCQGSFYLKEYFCLPYSSTGLGGVAEENIVCPNNGSCKDGACTSTSPSITVLSPNGGEKWAKGKTYDIVWKSFGVTEKFQIMLHRNYGSNNPWGMTIAQDIPTGTEKYSWAVPSFIEQGDNYQVEVQEMTPISRTLASGMTRDFSDNYFSIVQSVTCVRETAKSGVTCGGYFYEDYCENLSNGTGYANKRKCNASTGNDCSSLVNVDRAYCPYGCQNGICKTAPSITVLSPNGGEKWQIGTLHTISWQLANVPAGATVGLALYKGGVYKPEYLRVYQLQPTTVSYNWTIPNTIPAGNDYKMEVEMYNSSGSLEVLDQSDNYFSIIEGTCEGVEWNGYCWYEGTEGQNCTTVCASHGGNAGVCQENDNSSCELCRLFHPSAGCMGINETYDPIYFPYFNRCDFRALPTNGSCSTSNLGGRRFCACNIVGSGASTGKGEIDALRVQTASISNAISELMKRIQELIER